MNQRASHGYPTEPEAEGGLAKFALERSDVKTSLSLDQVNYFPMCWC